MSILDTLVRKLIERENAFIESTCEQSLIGRSCGVTVIRNRIGMFVTAYVDPDVPWGEVHVHYTDQWFL